MLEMVKFSTLGKGAGGRFSFFGGVKCGRGNKIEQPSVQLLQKQITRSILTLIGFKEVIGFKG